MSDLVCFSARVSQLPAELSPPLPPVWPLSVAKEGDKLVSETFLLPVRDTMNIDHITMNSEEAHAKEIRKHLIWVIVADPVWGRNDLLDWLVGMLN
jgi:hypothetical protein